MFDQFQWIQIFQLEMDLAHDPVQIWHVPSDLKRTDSFCRK
jgi:hypothetical protein